MHYRTLGNSGLRVSSLALGTWLTFDSALDARGARERITLAFDSGVTLFDTAESYGQGSAETLLGKAIADLPRDAIVVSTKVFWGGQRPNQVGLSRKHLIEGTHASLKRLGLDYVDLLFCHRPDYDTPLIETLITLDMLIRQGKALYWGTSQWPQELLVEALALCKRDALIPPIVEQPQYNLLSRRHFEEQLAPIMDLYGLGAISWSPLASGLLSGKYREGISAGSRLSEQGWLQGKFTADNYTKAATFADFAMQHGFSPAQLAIAWCLKNTRVSAVILGASSLAQLQENLGAEPLISKMDHALVTKIEAIFSPPLKPEHPSP